MRDLFEPLELGRAPRYREAAYTAIKEIILSGRLPPGQALMEQHIAAALEISRTPVREALAVLEHEGLIGPRGGRGLHVRHLTREDYVEMFVANEAVEPYMARQAAARATGTQVDDIEEAIARGEWSVTNDDVAGFLRSGRDFHRSVGEAAGNVPLTAFVVRNEERTDLYLLSSGRGPNRKSMVSSNEEHRAILGAIRERDPEAAARLAIYHSQSLRRRFAPLFDSDADNEEVQDSA